MTGAPSRVLHRRPARSRASIERDWGPAAELMLELWALQGDGGVAQYACSGFLHVAVAFMD